MSNVSKNNQSPPGKNSPKSQESVSALLNNNKKRLRPKSPINSDTQNQGEPKKRVISSIAQQNRRNKFEERFQEKLGYSFANTPQYDTTQYDTIMSNKKINSEYGPLIDNLDKITDTQIETVKA